MYKRHSIRKKKGTSPGTPIFTGRQKIDNIRISLFDYSSSDFVEKEIKNIDELDKLSFDKRVNWINISGIHDIAAIEKIGVIFNLHPLVLEDIVNVNQSPKIEDYDHYLFIVTKMIDYDKKQECIKIEQVSFILGKNYLLTFQEDAYDVFDFLRVRIRENKGRVRKSGEDYLLYRLLDALTDNYMLVLEHLDEKIESIEDNLLDNPDQNVLESIHELRKDLMKIRRAAAPLREIIYSLEKEPKEMIHKSTLLFLRDLNDHVKQVMESLENYREIINGMHEIYISNSSFKLNQVVKVLTIISTIFIPLTFIVGIYGMNFNTNAGPLNMPELNWKYGYVFVMFLMVIIAVGLFIVFRKKKWF
ncbi:MAG: magnesium/cobalt transporter CorA [Ignavibacteriales bacterium]|nr:MAG: magnesium/cobalt transporter CorA [Ignavibacteriales bacterium]